MASWLDAALIVQGVVLLALAGMAFRRGPRHASMTATIVLIAFWGYIALTFALPDILGASARTGSFLFITSVTIWNAILLSVAIVYPRTALTGWRRTAVFATLGIPLGYLLGALTMPDLFMDDAGHVTARGFDLVFGPHAIALATPMVVFGVRWWLGRTPEARTQMAYATGGFILTNVNDSFLLVQAVGFSVGGLNTGTDALATWADWLNLARLSIVVAFGVLAAVRLVRTRGADSGARFVLGLVILSAVLSPLQVLDSDVHVLVDSLAFFLAFYGLARSFSFAFDFKIPSTSARTMLFGVGVTVLFIIQQTIEQFVGNTLGLAAGAVVAGATLAALAPVGSMLGRLRGTPPREAAGYETYRRFQIYRTALDGALADARIDPLEVSILTSLRTDLGLTMSDHERLVAELRARRRMDL